MNGANEDYRIARSVDPKRGDDYFKKGINATDNLSKIEFFTKCLEIDPKYNSAYFQRALAKHAIGDKSGALTDLGKLLELDPTDWVAKNWYNAILNER
ncbi:MAG: hypothetical protein NTW25_06640 [Candidatus Kapabacteria bacterium]|nr:hypothetical protein [Candidatus Kapabacteria bacterium]